MGVTLRELDGQRATFRALLDAHEPKSILVADQEGRCVELDLFPDGVGPDGKGAWLVKVTSGGRVLFDCGGKGVSGLDDEGIAQIIVNAFRAFEKPPPSN